MLNLGELVAFITADNRGLKRVLRESKRDLQDTGKVATTVVGKVATGVAAVMPLVTKAIGVAALAATGLGVATAAGVAVSLAAVAALGVGVVALGIKFASENQHVQTAFSRLATHVESRLRSMSGVYVPVLTDLAHRLGHVFDDAEPEIRKSLDRLAPTTQHMVVGVDGALRGLVPAIEPVVDASIPLLDRLAAHLPGIGAATGRMVSRVAGFVKRITPEIKPGIDRAVQVVRAGAAQISGAVGDVLGSQTVNRIRLAWPPVRDAVVDNVTKLVTAVRNKAVDVGSGLFNGIRSGLATGDWSGLGRTLGGLIRDQIGKVLKISLTITEKLGEAIHKVDWIGLGLTLGREAPSLMFGLALGVVNFDVGNALSGLGDHWFDVILGLIALAFTPAKVIGKIAGVLDRIPLVGPMLSWVVRGTKGAADGAVGAVGKFVSFLGREFLRGFRRVFPEVGAEFASWLELLPTRLGLIRIEIVAKAKAMVTALGNAIKSGVGWVAAKIGEIVGTILRPFAKAGGWLVGKGRDAVVGLGKGIASALGKVASPLRSIGGKVVGWVGDLSSTLFRSGVRLIGGFISGIRSKIRDVRATLIGLTGKLKSWKGPPDKDAVLLAGSGRLVMAGFVRGLESQYSRVRSSLGRFTQSLPAATLALPGVSLPAGPAAAVASGTTGGVSAPAPGLMLTAEQIARAVADAVSGALSAGRIQIDPHGYVAFHKSVTARTKGL